LAYIEAWQREGIYEIALAKENKLPVTVKYEDLKGILHNHTTYSDGTNTLKEMADHCKALGFEYLGICDHSKSGNFYNGGMYENRVKEQQNEIDALNATMGPFKIFKGIESDILNDGSLDYEDDVLRSFDFVVASIHTNLKMNEDKATARLIKAIEDPFTTILGHLSGRLLLKRDAYPLDYPKIIDACAANNVVIEINADPRRLDMDWRWVIKGIEKGVVFSINPDAHRKEAYGNMKYGVYMAEKAGLPQELTLNSWALDKISSFFQSKKG
jgi:DNA polymerase (family 10)